MYHRPPSQRGPNVSKKPHHDKKSSGENRPPRDVVERLFPPPPPPLDAPDEYSSDGAGGLHTQEPRLAAPPPVTGFANTSFSSLDGRGVSPFSRTTSQNGFSDTEQEKALHTAYHISFHGDKRVKETCVTVTLNDCTFLLAERTTSGQSDGVYQKNKKLWEHVPRGQVKVFVRTPLSDVSTAIRATHAASDHARSVSSDDAISTGPLSARGRHTYAPLATLCGLRKFGHWGDKSASVFAVFKEVVVGATAIERVDGVGGHVTALRHNDERYWLVGSKARHLLVRFGVPEEDVVAYAAGPTATSNDHELTGSFTENSVASAARSLWEAQTIARVWRQTVHRAADGDDRATQLHDTLCANQWTLCFDALLDGREGLIDYSVYAMGPMCTCVQSHETTCALHGTEDDTTACTSERDSVCTTEGGGDDNVEELAGTTDSPPHTPRTESPAPLPFPRDSLVFYAITMDTPSAGGLCLPPQRAYEVFHTHGLTTAARSAQVALGTEAFTALRCTIAAKSHSAGAVFYGTNEDGIVVQVWKCRCTYHTMEGVTQESVVSNGVFGATLRAKLRKSISNLSKVTRADATQWERARAGHLVAFSSWLYETKRMSPSMDTTAKRSVRDCWLSLQRTFDESVAEEGATADECPRGRGEDSVALSASEDRPREDAAAGTGPETIVMVGPQGCGKSTLARVLFALLEQCAQTPRWLNQDEVGSRHAYIAAIERTLREGICSHLLLDKMNLNAAARNADYGGLALRTALSVVWAHADGTRGLADVCFERICQRGDSHRSLKACAVPRSDHRPPPHETHRAQTDDNVERRRHELSLKRLRGIVDDSVAKMDAPSCTVFSDQRSPHSADASAVSSPLQNAAGEKRYSPTAAVPRVVELDVRWSVEVCVGHVWPRLCAVSDKPLLPLERLDLPAAVAMTRAYESLLSRHPHRTTSVVLEMPSPAAWAPYLPDGFCWEDKRKPPVHPCAQFVIHDFIADPSPSLLVAYDALSGTSVAVALHAIVSDCRATVLCAQRPSFLRRHSNLACARRESGSASDFIAGGGSPLSPTAQSSPTPNSAGDAPALSLLFAVVAQAKKVTLKYCRELVERLLIKGEEDPYCCVHRFPPGTATVAVTYALKSS